MGRNYSERTLCYVSVAKGLELKYGFWSGLKSDLRNNYGQVEITSSTAVQGLVLGANSPKPYRASKRTATGYESSWCSHDKVAALKKAGYQVSRPRLRSPSKTPLTQTVFVTINGVKYAWQMPNLPEGINLAELGIQVASATDNDLVFGASFPRPARAGKEATANGSTGFFSTFIDNSKEANLPAGYALIEPSRTALLV